MNRKIEDDELDKLLDEELIREAEMIERALLSDDEDGIEPMSQEELDASFDRLVERLKAEGVYRGDEEEPEKEKTGKIISMPAIDAVRDNKMRRRHKIIRAAGFAIVCFLGLLGGSMATEVDCQDFISKIDYFTGNDTKSDTDTARPEEGKGGFAHEDYFYRSDT